MLRYTTDTHAIMGLSLSQLGLFLATGILLTAVISFVFLNNWERTNELRSYESSFSALLEDIDSSFLKNSTMFQFPETTYPYKVHLSSEYIVISTKGFWDSRLQMTKRFLVRPWVRSSTQNWTTGNDLHEYLNITYGHRGVQDDVISLQNFTQLQLEQNASSSYYALHPLEIFTYYPVIIEKVVLFYDTGQSFDVLLVYQIQ